MLSICVALASAALLAPHAAVAAIASPAPAGNVATARVTAQTAFYPRGLQLQNGTWLMCAGMPAKGASSGPAARIGLWARDPSSDASGDDPGRFGYGIGYGRREGTPGGRGLGDGRGGKGLGSVAGWRFVNGRVAGVAPGEASFDFGNCNLAQLPSGRLLCAFRHHSNCSGVCKRYTVRVVSSDDGGDTWSDNAAIVADNGPDHAVWEPFLWAQTSQRNVTGEFCVNVAYARETSFPPGKSEQDIAMQTSCDGGVTWGAMQTVVHTPQSRNGMPGVAFLDEPRRQHLVCIFEGFWGGSQKGWGRYTVNTVRSADGGMTWGNGTTVFVPPNQTEFNAGAPQILIKPGTGAVYASFMTNFDPRDPAKAPTSKWPGDAYAGTLKSLAPLTPGSPIQWPQKPDIQSAKPFVFWPSLFCATGSTGGAAKTCDTYLAFGNASGLYVKGPLQ